MTAMINEFTTTEFSTEESRVFESMLIGTEEAWQDIVDSLSSGICTPETARVLRYEYNQMLSAVILINEALKGTIEGMEVEERAAFRRHMERAYRLY